MKFNVDTAPNEHTLIAKGWYVINEYFYDGYRLKLYFQIVRPSYSKSFLCEIYKTN